ncbi:hypothetical protein [Pseudescherichia sp.]|uniref:RCC1 domain-containing protein n=1 Tax=Pseudescherichia sp. TaxID=2055881 RepID=UPI00289D4EB1|nr:hypothetical protein [Pseudescherichia sp.]WPO96756.1 hypothetical protein SFA32_07350 [Buttiauxella sp. HR94]
MNENVMADTSTLVFYSEPNMAGVPIQVKHGSLGMIATSANSWREKSVSILGTDNLHAYISSSVETGMMAKSYFNHVEKMVTASISSLQQAFPLPQYTLGFIGVDSDLATLVRLELDYSATSDQPDTLAATWLLPESMSQQTTLSLPNLPGALGFVGTVPGSHTQVSALYGIFDAATGEVQWTGSGSLTIAWDGSLVSLTDITGFPSGWSFSAPVMQPDGSWLVQLGNGPAIDSGILYSQPNYVGSAEALYPHQLISVNSGTGWIWQSVKLNAMPVLLLSAFNPIDSAYRFTHYQMLRLIDDTPDFSSAFGTGTLPAQLLSLDNGDVQIDVQLRTTGSSDSALVMTQRYPLGFSTFADTAHEGVLAIVPSSGALQTVQVSYGALNGSGQFVAAGAGTLTARYNGAIPVVTPGGDLPASWNFSLAEKQSDGRWLVTLTDAAEASLSVMGARSSRGADWLYSEKRCLVALESNGQSVVTAEWQYEGESTFQSTRYFIDTEPQKKLTVSLAGASTVLNESNVLGNTGAVVARSDSGTVSAWGQSASGGSSPASTFNTRVTAISATLHAFAACNQSGELFAWGEPSKGGSLPSMLANRSGWNMLAASGGMFVARNVNSPYIAAWGDNTYGQLNVPLAVSTLGDVVQIQCNDYACAVLNARGQVYGWGSENYGGNVPSHIAQLTDIVEISASASAFCARRRNGAVVAWGQGSYGGNVPAHIASLTNIASVYGCYSGFCALQTSGTVVSWGSPAIAPAPALSNVVHVQGTEYAFCALQSSGSVYAWGDSAAGGALPAEIAQLTDVVALSATATAFAVLRKNGAVNSWGDSAAGGDSAAAISALASGVKGVYSGGSVFIAIKDDSTLVAWGNSADGGSTGAIPTELQGAVSYFSSESA